CLVTGKRLFNRPEYQIRCFAVFLIGHAACELPEAIRFMETDVSKDPNWRVQEILAMAFTYFYESVGHVTAHAVFTNWLSYRNPNLRRAVTEGLRPWHTRTEFKNNPSEAIAILSRFRNDESEYVRKSAGNALKDIGRRFPELVLREVSGWNLDDRHERQTWKHATRLICVKIS
ncbi:MAG TPA: DNA alkylation repair protein, partial [Spirochaetota bacterium]|nr:DNA alkylation repair protein [Spirochaetota bacterium]